MASQPLAQESKRCSRCREFKPANREHFSFIRCRGSWHPWCKSCCAEQRREDRARRPAHYAEIEKRRHERSGAARNAANRERWVERAAVYRANAAERLEARRDIYKENRRRKLQANPALRERVRERNRQNYRENFEQRSAAAKKRWANATPTQKLRTYFGAAIAHALAGRGKGGKGWQELVGYTASDLRRHLQRQFLPGMGWDNYGEWHVDHIVPVASFNFETAGDPDFRACWALTNLRPMWAADNIRKSDKRLYLI